MVPTSEPKLAALSVMKGALSNLLEVNFTGRSGEREKLWCERLNEAEFTVRTPPVFVDNISVGTIVRAALGDDGELHHTATLQSSSGATIRFLSPDGIDASELYLNRIQRYAQENGLAIGPASFVSLKCVSFHVAKRDAQSESLLEFLDELEADGLVKNWEIGDPRSKREVVEFDSNADAVVRHQRPS